MKVGLQLETIGKFVVVATAQDQEQGLGERRQKQLEQKYSIKPPTSIG